ncbi:MAG: V-type ATP synthase subunit E family protein [Candidatus Ratteibacteria bacterium]
MAIPEVRKKSASALKNAIAEEAQAEVQTISTRAAEEINTIIATAKETAAQIARDAKIAYEKEIAHERQKMLSSLAIDKRRILLQAHQRHVEKILLRVHTMIEKYRDNPEYRKFLLAKVTEGAEIVGGNDIIILYAKPDQALITKEFLAEATDNILSQTKKSVSLSAEEGDFNNPGLIIMSGNKRLLYDATLISRLNRSREAIMMELLKEME